MQILLHMYEYLNMFRAYGNIIYIYFFFSMEFLREPNCCTLLTLDGKDVSKTSKIMFFCFMHLVEN